MTELDGIVRAAVAGDGVASAAIFVTARRDEPGSAGDPELRLAAAAGIDGPPLDGLVAAVRHPRHPIRVALADAGPSWDVRPMNPGGPALRSHLPLRAEDVDPAAPAAGVLALAHDAPLAPEVRGRLENLANRAAALIVAPTPEKEIR
jgi:hypothetical protein